MKFSSIQPHLQVTILISITHLATYVANKNSYETPQVDVSIWIKSAASMARPGLNSEPQNFEYRTAEFRRMESLRSVF